MTREEILLRRMAGQYLSAPADMRTAARGLCGVQAQYLSNALHALAIRSTDFSESAAREQLVKSWTLRGTAHVFDPDDLPLFLTCGENCRRNVWDAPSFWNQREGWALTPDRQAELTEVIVRALDSGPHTREALKLLCRAHGMTEAEEAAMFDPWGGGLREAFERGFAVYAVCGEKTLLPCPRFAPMAQDAAAVELARRYFTHYGPATIHDAMYFFRAPAREVRRWLEQLPVQAAECGGRTYFYMNMPEAPAGSALDCVFLAGFDPFLLGYEKKESLILPPEHLRRVFSLAGIVFPTVLLHGRICAVWKRKGCSLTVTPFEALSNCQISEIRRAAAARFPDCAVRFAE